MVIQKISINIIMIILSQTLRKKEIIFAGSEINKKSENLGIFNFIDNQTIVVVFGINDFDLNGYEMTVSEMTNDKDIVEKSVNTENKTNIIDIYILDKKYNSFPDINFILLVSFEVF